MSTQNHSKVRLRTQYRAVRHMTLFVVFVCVALLAVNAWLAVRGRDEALRQAAIADTNLARAIAQQMDSMVSETIRILDTIAFEMDSLDKDPTTLTRLQPVLVNYAARTEQIHSLFVLDSQGGRLTSSEATINPFLTNADRDYFTSHRDSLSLLSRVGRPILSRLSNTWLIPISRRLNDPDGQFAGVVLATIEVAYIRHLMTNYEIGQHGALLLAAADGTVLGRRPFAAADTGRSLAGTAQLAQLQKYQSGTTEMFSAIDGVERIVSYQHLKNNPLFVTVALSKQEVLESWRTTTYVQTGWIALLCSFIGVLGSIVVLSVRGRVKVEYRLRAARDELTAANTQLMHLARHDGLTGLANRRYFDEHLTREFIQAQRTRRPLALIMIDVDRFKLYNDTYGHPQGDKCLQAVASAIASAMRRPHDFVARYGGEEIVVLLAETDLAGAVIVAEAIRLAVKLLNLPFESNPVGYVTISAGVATHTPAGARPSAVELLTAADNALYRAKRDGRNTVATDL
jgi:diguanylate cyclase (GGDEF)-like protein